MTISMIHPHNARPGIISSSLILFFFFMKSCSSFHIHNTCRTYNIQQVNIFPSQLLARRCSRTKSKIFKNSSPSHSSYLMETNDLPRSIFFRTRNEKENKILSSMKQRKRVILNALVAFISMSTLIAIMSRPAIASTISTAAMTIGDTMGPTTQLASSSLASATTAVGVSTSTSLPSRVYSLYKPRTLGSFQILPSKADLELSFRLIFAAFTGGCVGWDRQQHPPRKTNKKRKPNLKNPNVEYDHKPAGVRTMALVSLGACAFTLCSIYGFSPVSLGIPSEYSNVKVDPSRMASNVASGVGFIGAGVITNERKSGELFDKRKKVNGLTTAAAIWTSAACGVASGVGLYFVSAIAALGTIAILKAPKRDSSAYRYGKPNVVVSSSTSSLQSNTPVKSTTPITEKPDKSKLNGNDNELNSPIQEQLLTTSTSPNQIAFATSSNISDKNQKAEKEIPPIASDLSNEDSKNKLNDIEANENPHEPMAPTNHTPSKELNLFSDHELYAQEINFDDLNLSEYESKIGSDEFLNGTDVLLAQILDQEETVRSMASTISSFVEEGIQRNTTSSVD